MSELCLTEYYVHEFVGGGDATTLILLPCVRERVPRTYIEECGASKIGVTAVEKRKPSSSTKCTPVLGRRGELYDDSKYKR